MKQNEVEQLIIIQNEAKAAIREIIKTPTSWVVLTDYYAYKIKQPVKTSFLDYSTRSKRNYYCTKELLLNRRLAEKVYIKVVPIFSLKGTCIINGTKGSIVDYAVMMHKMNHHHQMDILLKEGKVTTLDIEKIAHKIAAFHKKAQIITLSIDQQKLKNDFNDIRTVLPYVRDHLSISYTHIIEKACSSSDAFIERNAEVMQKRALGGYYRDCHGDLHAKNIILENEPIIFDCIEFDDSLRQIDVLNEIAFFCMELEAMDKDMLSNYFIKKYLEYTAWELDPVLVHLTQYYKMYKANIRAKVTALQLSNPDEPAPDGAILTSKLKKYLEKMATYNNTLP